MNELNLPDFLPEQVKQRLTADAAFILKFRELAKTDPDWASLTFDQRVTRARAAIQ